MHKKIAKVTPRQAKEGRFLRLPPALDLFLVEQAATYGYKSPQEYITDLIRREYQKHSALAKAA